MTEVTLAKPELHNMGDLRIVYADLTNIQNNYTLTVPHLKNINFFTVTTTTDDDVSGTVSGNVITFKCGATLAGRLKVEGF
jgi:hypothetical protein